ncbi:hypothetical protein INR49_028877 [Caranx melampygus]|nr:hypothetical protein INR49_028877 [Caranx melampygus]
MTRQMESNKRNLLLFLLLALLCVGTVRMDEEDCPSSPDTNLTCYNDYSRNITCVWNSTHEHTDAHCKLHAKRSNAPYKGHEYHASCELESVDTRSVQKKCSLYFDRDARFQSFHELSINLTCNHVKKILTIPYKPVCHIKLDPPGKPVFNVTTVSWQIEPHDPSVQIKQKECDVCDAELDPDSLIEGETYEARVRVQTTDWLGATWSDWGPTASWVSSVGRPKPLPSGVFGGVLGICITGVTFALFLAVMLLRNEKVTWVYKKITELDKPSLCQRTCSFFLNTRGNHLCGGNLHCGCCNTVQKGGRDAGEDESENSCGSTSSSFSNPSYSHLCTSPPVSSLTIDNLQPCPANTLNASLGSQGDSKTAEEKKMEIQQLLSKDNNNTGEPVQVVSDYERAERPQTERFRLQSLDSGMCSGEEVSQESLEVDSFSATDGHDEESGDKKPEREERTEIVDFKKLFGSSGNVSGKGSIQICSDYEKIPMLNPGSPELSSLDSGVCSGGEEQASHEEIQEDFDKSTRFQFPPPPSSSLPCPLLSFPQLPLKFSEIDFSPALHPPDHLLERIALMTLSRSMEPVDDGYMPVKQEQS